MISFYIESMNNMFSFDNWSKWQRKYTRFLVANLNIGFIQGVPNSLPDQGMLNNW